MTEGEQERTGNHELCAVGEDGETTALVVPHVRPAAAGAAAGSEAQRQSGIEAVIEAGVRPRVLLLGSDELSRELTVALQHLGAEVIAVDGYPDAPAHQAADQSLVVTMTDADELAAVIAQLQPDFVVTLTDAVSVEALEALSALEAQESESAGGFTELVPSARCVRVTADRESLRKLAADQLGLPTAPFWFVGSLAELEAVAAHAGFPLTVKGTTGEGHSVVVGPDQVGPAWHRAIESHTGVAEPRVWAETVVDVEFLVTLIVVVSEGPSGPVIEFCSPIGHHGEDAAEMESWQPQKLNPAAVDAAKSIAARIVKALGGRGVFSVELMINGDEVYFAEVTTGARESAWVTLRSQRLSAFELQARAILGVAVDTMMVSPGAARVIDQGPAGPGVAPSGDVLAAALCVPESDLRVFGPTATGVPAKWGLALATAPEVSAARDRARQVATRLYVRDSRP